MSYRHILVMTIKSRLLMKKCILIVTLFFTVHLHSQEIPLPIKCFPLNGADSEDVMSGQQTDTHGDIYALADRFGVKGKAVSFGKEDSYLSFPLTGINIQEKTEFTFTYWAYVGTDSIAQTFWAKDDAGNLLLGMGKRGTRAVLNIYHKNSKQSISTDMQWMWNDSNFSKGVGWYFIAIAYAIDGTHFYMVTPKGEMTECYSAFTPDWNLISSICMGAVDGTSSVGMDDFKVYNTALSGKQVSTLYQSESRMSLGSESPINVETGIPLYSSKWYFHCVGSNKTMQYALQNQTDLSFLSADDNYALSTMPGVNSDNQRWILSPVKDTSKGHIFIISNCATGMNLTNMHGEISQDVSDDTNYQKWCIGQFDIDSQVQSIVKKSNDMVPLYEEIYFDKRMGAIRVRLNFPEMQNVKIRFMTPLGVLLHESSSTNVQVLEKDFQPQINGIYLVTVESDNYRISKKVFVDR